MTTVDDVRARLSQVHDPELPVITIADLGVLRDVELVDGRFRVTLTPTYSGCPAMDEIRADVRAALDGVDADIVTVLSPAWTTAWLTDAGREALAAYGIAPPGLRTGMPVPLTLGPTRLRCPQCGSSDTVEMSRFGSTACKSMWRCQSCREPFDHFRDH